jgi:NAD(P)-dependent dehydrogenase (short-subunit alcohol dehydrogenase family)
MSANLKFDRKTVLITGAAGHIGRKFCEDFSTLGGRCILVDKDQKILDVIVESLNPVEGGDHFAIEADLGDAAIRKECIKVVKKKFNKLDILVNNAAFTGDTVLEGWLDDFEEQSIDAWEGALSINLTACFDISKSLIPLLREGHDPSILNLGSIYGMVGPDMSMYDDTKMGNPVAYAASKGGLLQMTRWLSTVLAPDIRVNSVSPGGVIRGQPDIFLEKYCSRTPLGRLATEEDISNGMLFLVSSLASYITGHNLVIDGGFTSL